MYGSSARRCRGSGSACGGSWRISAAAAAGGGGGGGGGSLVVDAAELIHV